MYELNALAAATYAELDLLCLLIILILGFVAAQYLQRLGQKVSSLIHCIIASYCVYLATDAWWVVGEYSHRLGYTEFYIINTIFFICLVTAACAWFTYVLKQLNYLGEKDFLAKFLIILPAEVFAIFAITAFSNGLLFFINENMKYDRGPLFTVFILVNYGYIVLAGLLALYNAFFREKHRKGNCLALAAYSLPILIFGLLQLATNFNFTCVGYTLSILILFAYEIINQGRVHSRQMAEAQKMHKAMTRMQEGIVELLGDVVESRDAESGAHIQRVKSFTDILARRVMQDLPEYGLDEHAINVITFASALHDVGKIAIPDSILLKPGRLTKEEFEIMKTHCIRGVEILRKAPDDWNPEYLRVCEDICYCHHEKWDGKGYPEGLKGDAIPIAAQIVGIADCYDALTSKRPYKEAFSSRQAYEMIMLGDCGSFSPQLLMCLKACKDEFAREVEKEK